MKDFFQVSIIMGILSSGVRLAVPFLLAALGEMFTQRSGVLNLGVEGVMLLGAFFSFLIAVKLDSLFLAVLITILIGLVIGVLAAVVNVTMKAEQGISGIGVYIIGLGLSGLFFRLTLGSITKINGFKPLTIPILARIPYVGEIFFKQNWMVYFALLLVPVAYIILFKTTFGLKVRAVGEHPHTADSLGVSVPRIRYICIIIGSILAALAGAFLTIGQQEAAFVDNISAGRGFIAVALVYFGRWHPAGILAGSFLFSLIDALQLRLQIIDIGVPYEIAVMAPYVVTIVVLSFFTGKVIGPTALTKPFDRGEA
ncbi:MAG: ABC transporter permease [Spirochaetota bacterium]